MCCISAEPFKYGIKTHLIIHYKYKNISAVIFLCKNNEKKALFLLQRSQNNGLKGSVLPTKYYM
jgi:hypothetical protein